MIATKPARMRWDECIARLPTGFCVMAEVGVWRGDLSRKVLAARPELHLYLVDPWRAGQPGEPWYDSGSIMAQRTQTEMDRHRIEALRRCSFAAGRFTELRMESKQAAESIEDGSLDMVFIDANHTREAVAADIETWLPKVRPGGYIGGHDFEAPRWPGVAEAVLERFGEPEAGANATWFVRVE